jgi:hypothetical protein
MTRIRGQRDERPEALVRILPVTPSVTIIHDGAGRDHRQLHLAASTSLGDGRLAHPTARTSKLALARPFAVTAIYEVLGVPAFTQNAMNDEASTRTRAVGSIPPCLPPLNLCMRAALPLRSRNAGLRLRGLILTFDAVSLGIFIRLVLVFHNLLLALLRYLDGLGCPAFSSLPNSPSHHLPPLPPVRRFAIPLARGHLDHFDQPELVDGLRQRLTSVRRPNTDAQTTRQPRTAEELNLNRRSSLNSPPDLRSVGCHHHPTESFHTRAEGAQYRPIFESTDMCGMRNCLPLPYISSSAGHIHVSRLAECPLVPLSASPL